MRLIVCNKIKLAPWHFYQGIMVAKLGNVKKLNGTVSRMVKLLKTFLLEQINFVKVILPFL